MKPFIGHARSLEHKHRVKRRMSGQGSENFFQYFFLPIFCVLRIHSLRYLETPILVGVGVLVSWQERNDESRVVAG